jgi:hypothetical protein
MADTLANSMTEMPPAPEQKKPEDGGFLKRMMQGLGFGGPDNAPVQAGPTPAAPVSPAAPEANAQVAAEVDKNPQVVDQAGKGLLTMTASLPDEMKVGFNNEYAKIKSDYEARRDSLAWVEGITMLAQFALKMVAANKSMKEGYDYTSGVHIDPAAFSGAYKSLKDDYEMGLKDIQFRLQGAERGAESARDAEFRQSAEATRAGEAKRRLGQEDRQLGEVARHNKAMEDISRLGSSQSLNQGMNPKDYATMQMEIDTLQNIGDQIIAKPQEMDGWGWSVYDNPEDIAKLTAMGVKIPKDLTHATPEEKALMGASLKAAMNKRRKYLESVAPSPTGSPKSVRSSQSGPVGVLSPSNTSGTVRFKIGDKTYDVPSQSAELFAKDHPEAVKG